MQGIKCYKIDVTRTDGSGEFKCPRCGIEMSPDDVTEDAYTILETVMQGDLLQKIVLKCNRCRSQVHLMGFDLLKEKG